MPNSRTGGVFAACKLNKNSCCAVLRPVPLMRTPLSCARPLMRTCAVLRPVFAATHHPLVKAAAHKIRGKPRAQTSTPCVAVRKTAQFGAAFGI